MVPWTHVRVCSLSLPPREQSKYCFPTTDDARLRVSAALARGLASNASLASRVNVNASLASRVVSSRTRAGITAWAHPAWAARSWS